MVSAHFKFESLRLLIERLEDRTLLASGALAAIGGVVYSDLADQGFTEQAPRLEGVRLAIFRDGGNGRFEAASSGGDDLFVAEAVTDELGQYRFGGLEPGRYFVFQRFSAGYMRKPEQFVLTHDVSQQHAADGATLNSDIANFEPLSFGGEVWNDLNNDGLFDREHERGIANVLVNLYRDDDHDGKYTAGVDSLLQSVFTDVDGRYVFVSLFPGDYLVQIDEANFSPIGALHDLFSSSPAEPSPDPNDDVDNDDNGEPLLGHGVLSGVVTLIVGAEPIHDSDADQNTNLTVDFGFLARADLEISVESSPTTATAGEVVTLTVTVTNHGPSQATSSSVSGEVTINVPGEPVSAAESCITTHPDGGISINFESLPAGESLTCSFTIVIADPPQPGTFTTTLQVSGNEFDGDPGNNQESVEIQIVSPVTDPGSTEIGLPPSVPNIDQPEASLPAPSAALAFASATQNANPLSETIGSGGNVVRVDPRPPDERDDFDVDVDYSDGADELDGVLAYLADAEPPRLLAIDVGDEVVRQSSDQAKERDSGEALARETPAEQEPRTEEDAGTNPELGHSHWTYLLVLTVPAVLATVWSYRHALLGALRRSHTGYTT